MNNSVVRSILIAMALISGCASQEPSGQDLTPVLSVDGLRTQFNADKGRVRVVLLMSPT